MSDAPEWPGLPEGEAGLLTRIVRLNMLVTTVLDRLVEPYGLSVADYLVLATIRRSPDRRASPVTVAGVLGRTTGGLSLAVDRLAAAGWVRRLPDPADRRRIALELTAEGRDIAESVNASLHEWEAGLPLPAKGRGEYVRHLDELIALVEDA
ncbi:MarR family winged helix-turn-helix transcriptional regulator [Streptodolium elevatio]|uniref:MarR family transcriptional regulator n=1 Tax=Streptodolium elevatio TaxID=3157996 RepID=A0ABV3DL64_9ACTN